MNKVDVILSDLLNGTSDFNLKSWNYYQEWNDAIFLHFEIPFNILNDFIPSDLKLDSYNNKFYVSLVAFTMEHLRPKNLMSSKFISNFHEVNIRTYVVNGNKQGVYFINIEANNRLSVFIAKALSGLPYEKSIITRNAFNYQSINLKKNLELDISFKIQDKIIEKTSFDKWLLERYCLFFDKGSKIYRYDIYHKEWQIKLLDLDKMILNYQFDDLILCSENLVKYHYSEGVNVLSWPRVKIVS